MQLAIEVVPNTDGTYTARGWIEGELRCQSGKEEDPVMALFKTSGALEYLIEADNYEDDGDPDAE